MQGLASTGVSKGPGVPADYPQHYLLQDILKEWNPDDVIVPKSYGKFTSLKQFDFQVRVLCCAVSRQCCEECWGHLAAAAMVIVCVCRRTLLKLGCIEMQSSRL
jgi:hypothetical protein